MNHEYPENDPFTLDDILAAGTSSDAVRRDIADEAAVLGEEMTESGMLHAARELYSQELAVVSELTEAGVNVGRIESDLQAADFAEDPMGTRLDMIALDYQEPEDEEVRELADAVFGLATLRANRALGQGITDRDGPVIDYIAERIEFSESFSDGTKGALNEALAKTLA